ncbi:hypothetical protein ACSBR1_017739 [Camellia fascicularis]
MKKTEIAILILQGGGGNRDCDFRRKTTIEEDLQLQWKIWNFGRKMTVVGVREEEEGEEKRVRGGGRRQGHHGKYERTSVRILGIMNITFAALRNLQTNFGDLNWASDNELTGSIPEFIGNWSKLKSLRFQGNSFGGPIPTTFSNLTLMEDLRISDLSNGSSSLAFLKDMKSLNLLDLSYNELSGSFPFWISQQDLQLNLVANNFTIESSNNSVLPSGLSVFKETFPAIAMFLSVNSNFAVKCGGPQITSSNQIIYERDNETLGPATYYVTSTNRWAISNVGRFGEKNNAQYTSFSSSQFTNTLDSELYCGLGLQNGNYTVSLQFVELTIENPTTWKSLGQPVFDIYIQGNLEWKDFDLRMEAGGASLQPAQKEFEAQVSENYIEIHFFWAGKGTCCVPTQGTYGPSISPISVTSDFIPTVSNNLPTELRGMDGKPYTFSYAELRAAVEDFYPANKLGEGGFGPVYKGTLNDGRVVAVKQLSVASRQGKSQFVTEITTISAMQHQNLVKLYGCCIEGDKLLLVYEYLENMSLDQALFGNRSLYLDWPTRFDICFGVARGPAYLHEESRLRIVHRGVKASDILLDSGLNPKISDFGLAKLYDDKKTHMSTRVVGDDVRFSVVKLHIFFHYIVEVISKKFGYLAPGYAMRGHLTEKVDVFSFGVVALEIVNGRLNSNSSLEQEKIYLLEWV